MVARRRPLVDVRTDDPETTLLRAVGEPAALSQLAKLVEKRRAVCEGVLDERMEVPMRALGMFLGSDRKLSHEVEIEKGLGTDPRTEKTRRHGAT